MNHVLDDKLAGETAPLTSSPAPPPVVTPTTDDPPSAATTTTGYVFGALGGSCSVDSVANFTDWSAPITTPAMNGQATGKTTTLRVRPFSTTHIFFEVYLLRMNLCIL